MRCAAAAIVLFLSAPVLAQVNSRPTEPPTVSAGDASWYRQREPLIYAGSLYHPAGPVVFFDGNVMVRTGYYNGVPLYADTTIEPYSIVLVPIGRGQMQPYERIRDGELAGTSGSRAPSFPGTSVRSGEVIAGAPGAPTNAPLPIGAIGVVGPDPGGVATTGRVPRIVAPEAAPEPEPARRGIGRPFRYDSISVRFNGEKWVMAGPSVPTLPQGLVRIADYQGFPVYAERGREHERIYLPFSGERMAPFRPAKH